MPGSEIDPSSVLKKLFSEPRITGESSPLALFQSQAPAQLKSGKSGESETASEGGPGWKRLGGKILQRFTPGKVKRQQVVGVDLGSGSVKVVRLESAESRARVTGVTVEELPSSLMEGPEWEKAVREVLARLKRQGLLSGPVVLGFYHFPSLIESIRLPKMPLGELAQSVRWEAKERLAIDPEQSVIQFLVTGEPVVDGQPQLEVLVISASRAQLLAQWRLLAELGLKVMAAEPIPLAGFYALSRLDLWKPLELVGLLEIGMKFSHLCFVRGQAVRFSRSFQVAGDSFTRSIADYCQIDYADGERLKREYGISKMALEEDRKEAGHEGEERVRISHALGLHMEQLVAEIEQSYRYFAFELGGSESERMDRLIVTGGGGLLKNVCDFLASRLSVPVSPADPIRAVTVDPAVQEQLKPGWSQRLSVPMGLALRPVS